MSTVDHLIKEKFVPFRHKVIETLRIKHPHILPILEKFIGDKKNKIGLQVTDNGKTIGEFTFRLSGIDIEETELGNVSPEFHHPFLGVIKPYVMMEKSTLEKIIQDDGFCSEPLATFGKHLPDITFKFKR